MSEAEKPQAIYAPIENESIEQAVTTLGKLGKCGMEQWLRSYIDDLHADRAIAEADREDLRTQLAAAEARIGVLEGALTGIATMKDHDLRWAVMQARAALAGKEQERG